MIIFTFISTCFVITFFISVASCTITWNLQPHEIFFLIVLASFLFVIIVNTFKTYVFCFLFSEYRFQEIIHCNFHHEWITFKLNWIISLDSIRYTSETKLSWKVNIFIVSFKLKDFFSINKQITIISIIMQTQTKFCVCFTKINTKRFLWWTRASINSVSWTLT